MPAMMSAEEKRYLIMELSQEKELHRAAQAKVQNYEQQIHVLQQMQEVAHEAAEKAERELVDEKAMREKLEEMAAIQNNMIEQLQNQLVETAHRTKVSEEKYKEIDEKYRNALKRAEEAEEKLMEANSDRVLTTIPQLITPNRINNVSTPNILDDSEMDRQHSISLDEEVDWKSRAIKAETELKRSQDMLKATQASVAQSMRASETELETIKLELAVKNEELQQSKEKESQQLQKIEELSFRLKSNLDEISQSNEQNSISLDEEVDWKSRAIKAETELKRSQDMLKATQVSVAQSMRASETELETIKLELAVKNEELQQSKEKESQQLQKIEELSFRLKSNLDEISQLKSLISQLQSTNRDLESKLQRSNSPSNVSSSSENIHVVSPNASTPLAMNANGSGENGSASFSTPSRQKTMGLMGTMMETFQKEKADWTSKLEEQKKENYQLQSLLTNEKESLKNEREKASAEIREKELEIERIRASLLQKTQENVGLEQKLRSAKEESENLKQQQEQRIQAASSNNSIIQELASKAAEAEDKYQKKFKQAEEMQRHLEEMRITLRDETERLAKDNESRKQAEVTILEKALSDERNRRREIEERERKIEERRIQAEAEVATLKAQIQEKLIEIVELNKKINSLEDKIEEAEHNYTAMVHQKEEANVAKGKWESTAHELSEKNTQLLEKMHQLEFSIKELNDRNGSLHQQVERLSQRIQEQEQESLARSKFNSDAEEWKIKAEAAEQKCIILLQQQIEKMKEYQQRQDELELQLQESSRVQSAVSNNHELESELQKSLRDLDVARELTCEMQLHIIEVSRANEDLEKQILSLRAQLQNAESALAQEKELRREIESDHERRMFTSPFRGTSAGYPPVFPYYGYPMFYPEYPGQIPSNTDPSRHEEKETTSKHATEKAFSYRIPPQPYTPTELRPQALYGDPNHVYSAPHPFSHGAAPFSSARDERKILTAVRRRLVDELEKQCATPQQKFVAADHL